MEKPVLVVMAAGMGSRYGGLKQMDPVDAAGHVIVDFSIYDAMKAGFHKVIFIIKKEMKDLFEERIGSRIRGQIEVEYVFQEKDAVPDWFMVPSEREKPWGTGHAVLCCMSKVNGPFAVINADDFYGRTAFAKIYDFLAKDKEENAYTMVGYRLGNTLTEHGSVARGVCEVTEDGYLKTITERTKIERDGKDARYYDSENDTWIPISADATVSMNLWGFEQSIFTELKEKFEAFLNEPTDQPLKREFFLPSVVSNMIEENRANVTVLTSPDRWFGVTYKEDKKDVMEAIKKLKEQQIYPEFLWKK